MRLLDAQDTHLCVPDLADRVEEMAGANLRRCYQCFTCTLGCPVAFAMDYQPHQLVRMVQLGMKEQVLSSSTIWLCAGCESCATRCPNDVRIVRVMDALRQIAVQEGVAPKEESIVTFHRTFLEGVQRWGRQYELGLMVRLILRLALRLQLGAGDLVSYAVLGLKYLSRAKLSLLPHRTRDVKGVRDIFDKVEGGKR
jgi:heterodisulfide reductase subunit C